MTNTVNFDVIGRVNSPYKEKFAIPRQPGVVTAAKGQISLQAEYNNIELVRGLEQFSHIWLLFIFSATQNQGWKPLVRPPRLGGNKKLGVLATRSTFRPNPIGMSVVKLDDIEQSNNHVTLHISELDLLDQTPIIDIKPYVPYADSIHNAQAGYAQTLPQAEVDVVFSALALEKVSTQRHDFPDLKELIRQILSQDPRPAYKQQKADDKIYGISLYHFNITWQVQNNNCITVLDIQ